MSSPYFNGADPDLLSYWLNELEATPTEYGEPILEASTVELIKWVCDNLKQDDHVFTMSVDILESYINMKNCKNKEIEDQLLVICTTVLICNKHIGENADLKLKYIELLYERISRKRTTTTKIKRTEIDILTTIDQHLPLYSKIDDLKLLLEIYVKPMKLKVDIVNLCVQILDVVYIYYKQLFSKLKGVYMNNPLALKAFTSIVTNKFYLPSGILLCALRLTKLQNFINLDSVTLELSAISYIHKNHLELLSEYILEIIDGSVSK